MPRNFSPSSRDTQGGKANKAGRILEKTILPVFSENGFKIITHATWARDPDKYDGDVVITGVPYTTIYGHTGKTEFVVKSPTRSLYFRVECKWQSSNGSVDEKFPYLYLNMVEQFPEPHIIVVLEGGGYKAGAKQWLEDAIKSKKYLPVGFTKKLELMSLTEFLTWLQKTL
jgi:hypothetical protein